MPPRRPLCASAWLSLWVLVSCACSISARSLSDRASVLKARSLAVDAAGTSDVSAVDSAWHPLQRIYDQAQQRAILSAPASPPPPTVQLLVGVKSSVVHGATSRQAIRETWASALPAGVRVVFLGCQPDLTALNATEAQRVQSDVARERSTHGDLLIDELAHCRDAYDDLVNKVLAFFQWSAREPIAHEDAKPFVMVADDDVYVRVDRLVAQLALDDTPTTRFYGGQVWATQFDRAIEPQRDPSVLKYYLSLEHYALHELPPFANGPHYLLSADVASFVGQHRAFFRGVGGDPKTASGSVGTLDDVSVALWMLAMQIHPRHDTRFGNLRDRLCRNDYVSYADVSSVALYEIHANLRANRSLCNGFSVETWLKQSLRPTADGDLRDDASERSVRRKRAWGSLQLTFRSQRPSHLEPLALTAQVSLDGVLDTATATYEPSSVSFYVFCATFANHVHATLGVLEGEVPFVCEQLRVSMQRALLAALDRTPTRRPILSTLLHNLKTERSAPMLKIVVSMEARVALVVVETLITDAFPGSEVLVVDEQHAAAMRTYWRTPDIVFFTTADAASDDEAEAQAQSYVATFGATSRLVLLHPREPFHASRVDPRIIAIVATTPTRSDGMYLPLAASAFAASAAHSPTELLLPFHGRRNASSPAVRLRQFCVDEYAASECEQPHREYFLNLLNALDRVESVGACPQHQTRESQRNATAVVSRHSAFFLDERVDLYEQFKFAIAFDDGAAAPGHVGDRIVAAFLAGSIPIYYGHSATAANLFNRDAFIDCSAFASLRACARHVLAVHASPSLYQKMRREPPVVNETAFVEAFSWHPDVVATGLRHSQEAHAGGRSVQQAAAKLKELLDNAN